MRKFIQITVSVLFALLCFTSCNKEELIKEIETPQNGEISVITECIVDGVDVTNTRAASEAGYTTGDGIYHENDEVIVTATANEGYELVAFYDKATPSVNLGASYIFPAAVPRTFKAEFAKKFTISASASPSEGGTVKGGGSYVNGASCTLTATPNSGYTFDGWYESGTKVSAAASYTFTVSSNRTITAKIVKEGKKFHFAVLEGAPVSIEYKGEDMGQSFSKMFNRTDFSIPYEHTIRADQNFEGWAWQVNGEIAPYGQYEELILDQRFFDKYPENTTFIYAPLGNSGATSYTVTIKADNWTSGKWTGNSGLSKVGFTKSNTNYQETITVKAGESVTVYTEGDNGYLPNGMNRWWYKVAGFYNASHVPYKLGDANNAGIDSYTFTVSGDMTIYVDFQYVSQ